MFSYAPSSLLRFLFAAWLLAPMWAAATAQSLLPSDVRTLDITGDTTANLSLTNGVVLSGSVRTERGDPIALGTLTAQSTDGMFTSTIQGGESTYRVALPPGTYDLNLVAAFLDTDETEMPTLVYLVSEAAAGLSITSDVTQALVAPNPPDLVTVSGLVDPQGAVPTAGALQFVAADGRAFTLALFEDFYTARLPLNTYSVRAALTFIDTEATAAIPPRTTAQVEVALEAVTVTDELEMDVTCRTRSTCRACCSMGLVGQSPRRGWWRQQLRQNPPCRAISISVAARKRRFHGL